MTTKDELRQIVDTLSDEDAAELLEYARWLQQEGEALSDAEQVRTALGYAAERVAAALHADSGPGAGPAPPATATCG